MRIYRKSLFRKFNVKKLRFRGLHSQLAQWQELNSGFQMPHVVQSDYGPKFCSEAASP